MHRSLRRADEIELAWKLIDPIQGDGPPATYAPGSWGPAEADALLGTAPRQWLVGCGEHIG